MNNSVFMEGLRTFLGRKSHILELFAEENRYIGRLGKEVDRYGIAVKNTSFIGGDYQRMHLMIQGAATQSENPKICFMDWLHRRTSKRTANN